ncbi:hypothetical protein KFE25_001449 [Diacronema lutheri]|uniref:Uncharacterized protein n=1 Tax=Diacronema lutheri TaxID=2081491 RepID=A0A8J5X603_DIALT|nr:hypothetical protein KFE25_001449 [Diacronema lutheri]
MMPNSLRVFAGSLRGVGYGGAVHLGMPASSSTSLDALAREFGLTGHVGPCEASTLRLKRRPGRWLGDLNQRRYTYYAHWTREYNVTRVWLLDQRDVVFTAHPFIDSAGALLMPRTDLAFFEDLAKMTPFANMRVTTCMRLSAEEMWRWNVQHRPHVSGGTIFGTGAAMRRLISHLQVQFANASAHAEAMCHENDQPILNVMLWRMGISGKGAHAHAELGAVEIFRNTRGVARSHACDGALAALRCARHACPSFVDDGHISSAAIWHKWDLCETELPALPSKAGLRVGARPPATARAWRAHGAAP